MAREHDLKIDVQPMDDLLSGDKTGEIRNDDRGFEVGDIVRLTCIDGRIADRRISHIQRGYGLPEGICVLSYSPTPVAPVSPDATGEPWPYQKTFNAIAAATRLESGCIFISVKDFVEAFGPTPDATGKCGELVTVGHVTDEGLSILASGGAAAYLLARPDGHAVVTHSQAEELLAAERAEKEAFAEEIKEAAYEAWPEANDVGSDAPQIIRQLGQERDKLEAELAATRAENARLMKINKAHCQTVNTLTIDGARLDGIIRDLKADNAAKDAQLERFRSDRAYTVGFTDGHDAAEAKLTAAEKALEPFAAVLEDYDPDWEDDDVSAVLVVGSVTHYGITLGDFRQARAALGGKAS